jgi:hypothetical protein
MKPLGALGLVLVIVGALVALVVAGLRPLGGAMLICGAGLLVYSFLPRSRLVGGKRGPYSWEEDEKPHGPRQIYTADPGEVAVRSRPPGQEPDFVSPTPGVIPPIRQQASGGHAAYTTGHAEVPEPRERERAAPEYTPPPQEIRPDDGTEAPTPMPGYPTDNLPEDASDIPPMAPPPPR